MDLRKVEYNGLEIILSQPTAVQTGSTRHVGHFWPIVPAPGDCEDGEVGGMNSFGRGNRSSRRKPAPTTLCPPQISLYQIQAPTRAAAVGKKGLTA
jgi:hypothetical protein